MRSRRSTMILGLRSVAIALTLLMALEGVAMAHPEESGYEACLPWDHLGTKLRHEDGRGLSSIGLDFAPWTVDNESYDFHWGWKSDYHDDFYAATSGTWWIWTSGLISHTWSWPACY